MSIETVIVVLHKSYMFVYFGDAAKSAYWTAWSVPNDCARLRGSSANSKLVGSM